MFIAHTAPVSGRAIGVATMPKVLTSSPTRRTRLFQPHAAPAIVAARVFADQFDTDAIQGIDDPGQGFDDAADVTDAGFHPLDGWQRNPGQFGQRPLVYAEQCPRRPHLERRNHATSPYMMNDK
jgi:hypothetical protein